MNISTTKPVVKTLANNGSKQTIDRCLTCKPCLQIPTSLGVNVVYIVAAVISENDKFLLIQEAKTSCYGRWYLPAGRVEKSETLCDAIKREVMEEAGYVFKPTGLVCVEFDGPAWMRFVFTGLIKGGSLKRRKDSESLQAQWFTYVEIEPEKLRSLDALRLIDTASSYVAKGTTSKILPITTGHTLQAYRILVVFTWNKNEYVLLTLGKQGSGLEIPTACFSGEKLSVAELTKQFLSKCMVETNSSATSKISFSSPKIFGVEHCPNISAVKSTSRIIDYDGVVIDCIIRAKNGNARRSDLPRLKPGAMCKWVPLLPGSELEMAIKKNEKNPVTFMDLSSRSDTSL